MTAETKKKIITLSRNIKRNTPGISRKLSKVGAKVDEAIIISVAKYYEALEKLAKE